MTAAALLVRCLRDPGATAALDGDGWTALIAAARAEQLAGTLAHVLRGLPIPQVAARWRDEATAAATRNRASGLWEAECVARVLAPLGCPVVLLKGSAYVAAGLAAGQGRAIGDCDVLVPRRALDGVEAALLAGGWEWVKPDPYDDVYYRRWMHELPPLIHRTRDRMIDVHHTILPPTARPRPEAAALIAAAVPLGPARGVGLSVLSPTDMIVHAACHLFADGDLSGGLRNLWDIHCLVDELGCEGLTARAAQHGLGDAVARALRLAHHLYGTPVPADLRRLSVTDRLYRHRLTARDGWGRGMRPATRLGFYIRSHWLRMPPPMLARHLWTKWRRPDRGRG